MLLVVLSRTALPAGIQPPQNVQHSIYLRTRLRQFSGRNIKFSGNPLENRERIKVDWRVDTYAHNRIRKF